MDTKTYIKNLVRECVEQKQDDMLREAIRPLVAETLKESFMEANNAENGGNGKISVKALVKKLMTNPKFKNAAKTYLSKEDGTFNKKDYDGWADSDKTYTAFDNVSDGSKRRIVTQRLSDKKMDWAPMAYELWPDMTEDAARSWFSKKVAGKGGEEFTDDEISALYQMLNNKM